MDPQEFTKLYSRQELDESLTTFRDGIGFSLIRFYPKDSPYYKDGKRIFIKVVLRDGKLDYGVDMTDPRKEEDHYEYFITEGSEYKKKVTNFISNDSEFVFDESTKKIIHQQTGKNFSMNEFVEILAANHLSDRLYIKKKLNRLAEWILKIIFWLSDRHYDRVEVLIDKYRYTQENKPTSEERSNIEPFFKYFLISKNLIFGILLLTFLIAFLNAFFPNQSVVNKIGNSFFGDFSLSNPLVLLFFFLTLFAAEKLSIWLDSRIKDFINPVRNYYVEKNSNFIEKLHDFQFQNNFKLNISIRKFKT